MLNAREDVKIIGEERKVDMAEIEKVLTELDRLKLALKMEDSGRGKINIMPCISTIDEAIQTIRELCEDCNRYHEWGFLEGYEEAKDKMNEDVCEWHIVDRPNGLPIYNTSCGAIRLNHITGVDVFCNGCGRKIKVME